MKAHCPNCHVLMVHCPQSQGPLSHTVKQCSQPHHITIPVRTPPCRLSRPSCCACNPSNISTLPSVFAAAPTPPPAHHQPFPSNLYPPVPTHAPAAQPEEPSAPPLFPSSQRPGRIILPPISTNPAFISHLGSAPDPDEPSAPPLPVQANDNSPKRPAVQDGTGTCPSSGQGNQNECFLCMEEERQWGFLVRVWQRRNCECASAANCECGKLRVCERGKRRNCKCASVANVETASVQ